MGVGLEKGLRARPPLPLALGASEVAFKGQVPAHTHQGWQTALRANRGLRGLKVHKKNQHLEGIKGEQRSLEAHKGQGETLWGAVFPLRHRRSLWTVSTLGPQTSHPVAVYSVVPTGGPFLNSFAHAAGQTRQPHCQNHSSKDP